MLSSVTPATFSAIMKKSKTLLISKKYEEALDVIILIQEDVDNFMKLGDDKLMTYYNNVACLYYLLRKPHLATCYFNKAHEMHLFYLYKLRHSGCIVRKSQVFNSKTVYNIMYNSGLCMLMASNPFEAFCYLISALPQMHSSSVVWLRLAECCMMVNKKDDGSGNNFLNKQNSFASGRVGTGSLSKIVSKSKLLHDSSFSPKLKPFCDLVPSLAFATICLKNSYLLLPESNSQLKQAVLAASSYVHLAIGGAVKAYKYALMLFKEASSNIYKYLSKLYLAESLISMNRTREAIDILKPTQLYHWDLLEDQNTQKCYMNTQATSQAILNYNLAVALTLNGEFLTASELIRRWAINNARYEVPIYIITLIMYIEVILDNFNATRIIIKQNYPQLFKTALLN